MPQGQLFTGEMLAAVRAVFDPTDVFLGYAYGSRVSGHARPQSDLDIGYYLNNFRRRPPLSIEEELGLSGRLSDRLGVEVDLHDLGQAHVGVARPGPEDGVRIYCRDEVQRVNLELPISGPVPRSEGFFSANAGGASG